MVLALEGEPKQRQRWARLVARAWNDDGFRQRLLAEPEGVLREAGIALPPGVPVRVVEEGAAEDGDSGASLRLPAKPSAEDLIEDELGLPLDAPIQRCCSSFCLCLSHSNFCACSAAPKPEECPPGGSGRA
jgi:hypothetical protein